MTLFAWRLPVALLGAVVALPLGVHPVLAQEPGILSGTQLFAQEIVSNGEPQIDIGNVTYSYTCDREGGETVVSFSASGEARDLDFGYFGMVGTFTESGTFTISPQVYAVDFLLFTIGYVTAWESEFTIIWPEISASGTKSLVAGAIPLPPINGSKGFCVDPSVAGLGAYQMQAELPPGSLAFEATVTGPDGTWSESGLARAGVNDYGDCCGFFDHEQFNETFETSIREEGPGDPASVVLTPPAATNTVSTDHSVTAAVSDANGEPTPDVTVRFTVSGSRNTSGQCTTDEAGSCTFTYTGPALAGADLIVACADIDNDGTRDPGEPCGEATKAWLLPTSSPGQVTGGGHVLNAVDGEEVAFGFNAKSDTNGLKGNCTVVDKAPARNVKIKCLTVDTLVQFGNSATIFGQAEMDGVTVDYRIDVTDNGEPGGGGDTFAIQTSSGYSAGGTLDNGNVQVHGQ
jgi:hypothetical protein